MPARPYSTSLRASGGGSAGYAPLRNRHILGAHGELRMAYDEGLAQRIRELLAGRPGVVAKKMFGGVGFLLNGNMGCGVHQDDLVVRVGPDAYQESLADPFSRPFDTTGRPVRGWVMVAAAGVTGDRDLVAWVAKGSSFASTLPAKKHQRLRPHPVWPCRPREHPSR